MEVIINYYAVLAATLAAIVLGSLWYGPLFGKIWMKEVGVTNEMADEFRKDKKKMRGMYRSYLLMAIASLIMVYVQVHSLAFAMTYLNISGVNAALQGAFWNWLGFVMPVSLAGVLWENKSWRWWFITAGYYLVALVIISLIIVLWP